jgi:hypothetical protein
VTLSSGRHVALAWPTGMRPWARPLARALFLLARHVRALTEPLGRLEVINVVRWTIIDRWPGPAGERQAPILLFEGDFDGDLQLYIDSFAEVPLLRLLMTGVWGTSYGFPHVAPTDGFHRWVDAHDSTDGHFYTAFPGAAPSTVVAALALDDAVERFAAASATLDDDAFDAAWPAFAREVQGWV